MWVKIFAELNNAAYWARSNHPEVLAEAINELLTTVEARRAVQSSAYDWLRAHDWSVVSATLEGMLRGLTREKELGWDYGRDLQ